MDYSSLYECSILNLCALIICFAIDEWQQTNKMKLEFCILEEVPFPLNNFDKLHKIVMRGQINDN